MQGSICCHWGTMQGVAEVWLFLLCWGVLGAVMAQQVGKDGLWGGRA
jgi:hypothetical protein